MTQGTVQLLGQERRIVKSALKASGVSLSEFASATSGWHFLRYLISCYFGAAIGFSCLVVGGPSGFIFGVLVLGVVQHAMLNIVHEASHFTLFRQRNLNDALGDFFFAVPIGLTVQRYRVTHERHHDALATELDPSGFLVSPHHSRGTMIRSLLFLLFGRAVFDMLKGLGNRSKSGLGPASTSADRNRLLKAIAYHAPLAIVLAYFGYFSLHLAWIAIAMTLTPFLDGVRTIAEHRFGDQQEGNHTRSHHNSGFVSAIFAPFFQYHWEHHLFPSIPHCRLPEFHQKLIDLGFVQARPVRGGFFGAFSSGISK